jgi:hypothetical protein
MLLSMRIHRWNNSSVQSAAAKNVPLDSVFAARSRLEQRASFQGEQA